MQSATIGAWTRASIGNGSIVSSSRPRSVGMRRIWTCRSGSLRKRPRSGARESLMWAAVKLRWSMTCLTGVIAICPSWMFPQPHKRGEGPSWRTRRCGRLAMRRCDYVPVYAPSVRRVARPRRIPLPHRPEGPHRVCPSSVARRQAWRARHRRHVRARGTDEVQRPRRGAIWPAALHDQFGAKFRLLRHLTEMHQTPAGATQQFTYCYCKTSDAT